MKSETDKIAEEALTLPIEARLSLVERLLSSLNPPLDADIDRAWAEEAERRVAQIETGKAKLTPGKKVFEKILEKHKA